jgi:hypothetical protein
MVFQIRGVAKAVFPSSELQHRGGLSGESGLGGDVGGSFRISLLFCHGFFSF